MLRNTIITVASLLITAAATAGEGELGQDSNNVMITLPGTTIAYSSGPGVGQGACPADINLDGKVDVDDLILVILNYGSGPDIPADINGDGVVDFLDLMRVIEDWGPCP